MTQTRRLALLASLAASSCGPGPATAPPTDQGATAGPVAEASAAPLATVTARNSGSAAAAQSSSPAAIETDREPRPDPATVHCGDKRCAVGKETCCNTTMQSKCVPGAAAGPEVRDLDKVYLLQCKDTPAPPRMTVFGRCDESQDCGAKEICCHQYTFARESSAYRCQPLGAAAAGPCPGEEACIVGGPPCRTPGAECIRDPDRGSARCMKRPANPDHVCDTAADCLPGQRCIHPAGGKPECVIRTEDVLETCKSNADCQAFCTDKRATCKGLRGGKDAAMPICGCPP